MSTKIICQTENSSVLLERTMGMPEGGPKCIPVNLDFTAFDTYVLDYSNMQSRNFFSMCQTVWVDNSANAVILTINIPGSQQTIKVPANSQAYYPVICPNPIKITFTSAGGGAAQVTLLNYPVMQ